MNYVTTLLDVIHGRMFRKFFFFENRSLKSIDATNVPVRRSRSRTPEVYVYQSLISKEGCYT